MTITEITVNRKFAELKWKLIDWLQLKKECGFKLEVTISEDANNGSMPSRYYCERIIREAVKLCGTKHKILRLTVDKNRRKVYADIAYATKWFRCNYCNEVFPEEAIVFKSGSGAAQVKYCQHCKDLIDSLE